MSGLLALAALAGTSFACDVTPRKFTVFAPAEQVLADYRVEAEGDGFGDGMKPQQVLDALPLSLLVSLDDGADSPIQIEIYDLDEAAGTAHAKVTEDLTPFSERKTMVEFRGACRVTRSDGKEAA